MTEEQKTITMEEAEQVLEAERRRRVQLCQAAMGQVLQEHGCELVGIPEFTPDGRTVVTVQIRVV